MNRNRSSIIALLLTLSFYIIYFHIYSPPIAKETSFVIRVIDGDTLELKDGRIIRLLNVNAPEKNTPISKNSILFMKSFENHTIDIEITGVDIYNRYLARIYSPNYINLELVSLGLASKFLVQESELKLFADAEKHAIQGSRGIWNRSIYYGCFSSVIKEKEEKIILQNSCNQINLDKWLIKDESRKIYTLSNISLGIITLHSGIGTDNSYEIFWNLKTDVWNNDRDTLYLFDESGNLVHYHTYGY